MLLGTVREGAFKGDENAMLEGRRSQDSSGVHAAASAEISVVDVVHEPRSMS